MRTLILLVLAAVPALPSTITYEFTALVSGRWARTSFTGAEMRLTTIADLSTPLLPGPAEIQIGSMIGTMNLSGFFINIGSCGINQEFPSVNSCVGVLSQEGLDFLDIASNALSTYTARSASGVVSDPTPITNLRFPFQTSNGFLTLRSIEQGTFSATVNVTHLPEPSSMMLLGAGLVALLHLRPKSLR